MTDQEIKDLLASYSLRLTRSRRSDESPVFLAWYEELPGCMAEAETRDAALLELDTIAPAIVKLLEADGLSLPVPASARAPRAVTNMFEIHGLQVGNTPSPLPLATAQLATRPTIIQGALVGA